MYPVYSRNLYMWQMLAATIVFLGGAGGIGIKRLPPFFTSIISPIPHLYTHTAND